MNLKTGLLIGTNPKNVGNLFKSSPQFDSISTLYIKLVSNVILESLLLSGKHNFTLNKEVFRNIVYGYYSSVKSFEHLDVRVLLSNFKDGDLHNVTTSKSIDVIYYDSSYSSPAVDHFVSKYVINKSQHCRIASYPGSDVNCNLFSSKADENRTNFKEYHYVVEGGTFDRLHLGHKLLLSEGVLRCRKRLTVGVCSDAILSSEYLASTFLRIQKCGVSFVLHVFSDKTLPELIDDCDTRIKGLEDFLYDVEPHMKYNIVPINDAYGPTKEDRSLEVEIY